MSRLSVVRHWMLVGDGFFHDCPMGFVDSYLAIERANIVLPTFRFGGGWPERDVAVFSPPGYHESQRLIRRIQYQLGHRTTGYADSRLAINGCSVTFPCVQKSFTRGSKSWCVRFVLFREPQFRAVLEAMVMSIEWFDKAGVRSDQEPRAVIAQKYQEIISHFVNASFQP